jgi:hypothetical protein
MKKNSFIFLLVLIFVLASGFSEGMLGLRTLEATETQQATEAAVEEEVSVGLNLRTIDPLLIAFRDGFKTPVLPGWKESFIGDLTFKIPMGFSAEIVKNGANYDGKIADNNGMTFAQVFLYQLDAYQLEELLDTLLKTLYGDKATEEKKFEEFKEYPNDKVAYFTRVYMSDQKISYPILFAYQKGETNQDIIPGSVLFLFIDPYQYQADADQEKLNNWIQGIAGSLLNAMTAEKKEKVEEVKKPEKVDKPEPEDDSVEIKGDNFGEKLAYSIENEIYLAELPENWQVGEADYFTFWYPKSMDANYYDITNGEVVDLVYQGVTMAKIFIGESDEYISEEDVFDELYQSYLSGLGSYKLVETTPAFGDYGSLITYEMDFSGYKGWVSVYSESDWEGYVYGEYLIFLGIAQFNEVEIWEIDYLDILISMQF